MNDDQVMIRLVQILRRALERQRQAAQGGRHG